MLLRARVFAQDDRTVMRRREATRNLDGRAPGGLSEYWRSRRARDQQRDDMQPVKADIDRHRTDWENFAKWSTRSIIAIAVILALMWFFVA
jgi:hypothetical protein